MCLVCGMISCGNEGNGSNHRVEHYKNTGHVYAQGIGANHKIIYDLTKGIPVHIMIYNSIVTSYNSAKPKEQEIEEETEVITTESNNNNVDGDSGNNITTTSNENEIVHKNPKEKTEFIISEYNSIISSQLENQRFYYRDKLKHLEDKKLLEQQLIESEIRNIQHEIKTLDDKIAIAEQAKTTAFTAVKNKNILLDNINTQLTTSENEYKHLSSEKKQLETFNLMATVDIDKEIKQQETEINELNQQIKDLHIHFNTVNTIGKRSDMKEFQNASIGMLLDIEGPKKSRYHKHKK
jgi:chromosome segregation ATPase